MKRISFVFFIPFIISVIPRKLRLPKHCCKLKICHVLKSTQSDQLEAPKNNAQFQRVNPMSDFFDSFGFHHIEFYCGDATSAYKRFILSLGMQLIAKSDLSTGNLLHASYALESGSVKMLFTAPYPKNENKTLSSTSKALPGFDQVRAYSFFEQHGFGVKAIAILVSNVSFAYTTMVARGAVGMLEPTRIVDQVGSGYSIIAEVCLYGDVVLRIMNNDMYSGRFFPNFEDTEYSHLSGNSYQIEKFDHIVGNLWSLQPKVDALKSITGFHEFAEFTTEDVGTVDSGLNSVVLANNNEAILLPLNEPTFGTKRKSQIQTFLEQNRGEGVQHVALHTKDIFYTLRRMKEASELGGFEFLEPPPEDYYQNLPTRLGSALTHEQLSLAKNYGVLADKDDQGVLLQIFTKPIGDRPTLFFEIIQRIGCMAEGVQRAGCGGFGKGNFKDLFKSIEDFEKALGV